jgi:enamine deaminase RidA (YjgF/YER057c/UK114 family)
MRRGPFPAAGLAAVRCAGGPVPTHAFHLESLEMSAEAKLVELGLQLPPLPKPGGVYKPVVIAGNMVYVSGHVSLRADGTIMTGRVGTEVDQDYGKKAAEAAGLAILATLRANLGSLDRIKRVIKTLGMVNCSADFTNHPEVINGCSELWAKLWGEEHGIGARSAVGMGSLPRNATVEVEAIFELA